MSDLVVHSARKLDADGHVDAFWFAAHDGVVTATGDGIGWRSHAPQHAEVVDAGGHWLTPGFVDLHGHGGGGGSYDGDADAIGRALALHRAHGTTRSVLSLVAAPLHELRASLGLIAELAAADPLIIGSHLEGPFLSPAKPGAHEPAYLREPDLAIVDELIGAGRDRLVQVMVAPELRNAGDAIDVLVGAGIHVAVGHTAATDVETRSAFDRGARILTHAFNAMNGIHHRDPGPIVAAFDDPRVTIELILDGRHVHPDVARLAFTAAPGRIALITDAMAAAGEPDGDYRLGTLDVTVTDGLALLAGGDTIAGSTLTQDQALRVAIERVGLDPRVAVEALTLTPARAIGRDETLGLLSPGFAADAVLLDSRWRVQRVWGAGAELSVG